MQNTKGKERNLKLEEEKMQCLQWNHSANNQRFLIRNHGN